MADTKISALTAATTPLAGTEVLPIVQSGTTVKVAVSNLTAGRSVAMQDLTIASTSGSALLSVTRTGISGLVVAADGSGPLISPTTVDAIQVYNAAQSVQQFLFNTSNGNFVAQTGNVVIGTSGKGIDFSATPGTGTSELLSDYEEGTFTATLTASSTAPTTPITATAYYTKIGRQVTCQILFSSVDTTGASGAILIQGLPFTPTNIRTVGACNLGGLGVIAAVSIAASGLTTMEIWDATQVNNILIVPGAGKSITATITYTA
jgi:hypothetical protein